MKVLAFHDSGWFIYLETDCACYIRWIYIFIGYDNWEIITTVIWSYIMLRNHGSLLVTHRIYWESEQSYILEINIKNIQIYKQSVRFINEYDLII